MVFRKQNSTAGFSLIEVLVAITILGLVVVPIGSSLVLSFRLNARSEQMLQAQLAVSSAVETIMAEGYNESDPPDFDGVNISATASSDKDEHNNPIYYALTVSDEDGYTTVETYVKPYEGGDT